METSAGRILGAGLAVLVLLGAPTAPAGAAGGFTLESPAFAPGGRIPVKHTCDGPDASPALRWSAPPAGTRAFALIADDPDAPVGTWVHWVIYDLPASARGLPEGVPPKGRLEGGAAQGTNDFGRIGYGGPCPPPGPAHRYFFKLYALSAPVRLPPGARKRALLETMRGRLTGEARLVGRYGR